MVGDYLRARNVAIDFGKSECAGRERVFHPGFLVAACALTKEGTGTGVSSSRSSGSWPSPASKARFLRVPAHLARLQRIAMGVSQSRETRPAVCSRPGTARTDAEQRFTVFVSRDDMGNYAHHLGDMLNVFQIFDHLQLAPSEATIALLDVRIMCWGSPCRLDCKGPFARLWGAISNGAPLVRASDWAARGPMCFREAAFATHWSEVAKLAWAPPSQCIGSTILRAFQLRVLSQVGLLDVFLVPTLYLVPCTLPCTLYLTLYLVPSPRWASSTSSRLRGNSESSTRAEVSQA